MCGSDNNRLMKYETWEFSDTIVIFGAMTQGSGPMAQGSGAMAQGSGPMAPGFGGPLPTLLSTTYYYYNEEGNVTRIVTNENGTNQYQATRLGYARNGRAVTYALGETWDYNGTFITSHTITYAREFRYDSARQRYLNRTLSNQTLGTLSSIWSDYDGNRIYGDFTVTSGPPGSPPTVTELRSFQPGIARVDPWRSSGSVDTKYYHADMIGTTREMTDSSGTGVSPVGYTAFGEKISGSAQRYGYAGAFGYQAPASDDPTDAYLHFPFLHVGHRYYNPATGRFLQRDPIGIRGGLNVYVYARNIPTIAVDPNGEFIFSAIGAAIGGAAGAFTAWVSGEDTAGIIAGAVGGAVAGALAGGGVPPPIAGAIGGAVSGAIRGYAGGKSAAGIAGSAGIGGIFGAAGGHFGGKIGGGYGAQFGAGAASGVATDGAATYFFKLPAAICGAAGRLPGGRSPGGPPF